MENLPLSRLDIERYMQSIELLTEVIAQINKDFQLNGFDVAFSGKGETAYAELTSELTPAIEYLLEKQPSRFWNLLYSIDLDESKVKKILFGTEQNSIDQLTDLILKRELQKVVIRRFYTGKYLP
ncbi:hypothetical protein ACFLR1_05000 [Bacteroidota bacterium]